jgi:hypothetical protein
VFTRAPTRKRLHRDANQRRIEELGHVSVESLRQAFQDHDCRIFDTALQSADVSPINLGINGQVLLGYAPFDPEPP